jgi:hypothetical protein
MELAVQNFAANKQLADQAGPEPRETLRPQTAWEKIKTSDTYRKLFGEDKPLGREPGVLPLLASTPLPFSLPGKAGQVLMAGFIANYLKDRPEALRNLKREIDAGDTKSAAHDIIGEILQAGLMGVGAKSALGGEHAPQESPAEQPAKSPGELVKETLAREPLPQEAAQQASKEIGFDFNPTPQAGGVKLEGLTPAEREAVKPMWEFTDRRPDSPSKGLTFYVPEGASKEQILQRHQEKMAEQAQTSSPEQPTAPSDAPPEPEPQPAMAGPGSPSVSQGPDIQASQEAQLMEALNKLPEGKGGKDSPTISVADRVGELIGGAKGSLSKWWLRTKAGAEQYKRLLLGAPRSEDDFWSVKKYWAANRQQNSGVAKEMIEKGKELVPKQLHQQAMGKYAEALMFDNPEEMLSVWAKSSKLASNRAQYEAAKALTPEQKQAVLQGRQYYEAKGKELEELGLLHHLIEDYSGQHMVDMRASHPPAELNQLRADLVRGTFNTNFKYALRRIFETEFALENAGYKLKTTSFFDKLANYAKSANDVLADRNAIKQWMGGDTKDGKPMFATGQFRTVVEGKKNDALLVNPKVRPDPKWKNAQGEPTDISHEYVKMEHPAFKKWQWVETTPDGKEILVQGDVWAHKSIADELKNTFGRSRLYDIPGIDTVTRANAQLKGIKLVGMFHQVKTGIHAWTHLVRPWGQPKVDPHSPEVYDAMRSGLQLFESRNAELFSEGLASSSILQSVANLPKTVTGIEQLGFGDRLRSYQEYLFQDYIPRIKMATYNAALKRNMDRYGKQLDANSIKQITATQINSAYGEQNWKLLGINPTFQHGLSLALLAPDFQVSQHGFVAQMFTPTGGENRMSAAIMIATVYTGARILNQVFDNDPHFEWKRAFSVVIGGREYGIRTIASDAQRAITDTAQFVYHRLSPIASSITENLSKVDSLGRKETTKQALENTALRAVPIPLTPRKDIGFVESAIAATFGYYAKRYSAVSDIHQLAGEWRKKNDPKLEQGAVQYPESKYTSLRQHLADENLDAAKKDYQELLKTYKASEVQKAMHPTRYFTGSEKLEHKFVASLTPAQKTTYDKAKAEKRVQWERFWKMISEDKPKE